MNQTIKLSLGIVGICSVLILLIPEDFSPENSSPNNDFTTEQPLLPAQPNITIQQFEPIQPSQNVEENNDDNLTADSGFKFGDPMASTDPITVGDSFKSTSNNQNNDEVAAELNTTQRTVAVNQPSPAQQNNSPQETSSVTRPAKQIISPQVINRRGQPQENSGNNAILTPSG